MIISVHLPKTAGTSFAAALEGRFGERLRRDYGDLPINTPPAKRHRAALEAGLRIASDDYSGVDCIHGHFLPAKYLLLADSREVRFVTWLRDPVERVVSHYEYWRRSYDPATAAPLHRRVVEEDWSLERFCLGPELRNLYGQFLWGFPVGNFAFLGVTERYDEDLATFGRRFLGAAVAPERLNLRQERADRGVIDPALRERIERHHARDVALYRWARARRDAEVGE